MPRGDQSGRASLFVSLVCAWLGCGGSAQFLEITGSSTAIDEVRVSAFGPNGAWVVDASFGAEPGEIELPARIRLNAQGREGTKRLRVWGYAAGQKVSYATTSWGPGDTIVEVALEAPPPDRDLDGVPDAEDGCPDAPDPSQADADADGVTDACSPGCGDNCDPPCPGNLLANPDFETDVQSWLAQGGSVTAVEPGFLGTRAARICRDPSTVDETSLRDIVAQIPPYAVGAVFEVTAWVRSWRYSGAVEMRLREVSSAGGSNVITDTAALTPGWIQLSAQLTVTDSNTNFVQLIFIAPGVTDDHCFDVDAVCARALP